MKCIKGSVVAILICVSQLVCRDSIADDVSVNAYTGEPLGVAILTVPENLKGDASLRSFPLEQLGAGALYPASDSAGSCYFLFDSKATKEVVFQGKAIALIPVATVDSGPYSTHLDLWWKAFVEQARRTETNDSYPLQIDQYLLTMLAKRLHKPDVELKSATWLPQDEESRFLAFLTGTESIRIAMQKDALLATAKGRELATEPIPKATLPPAVTIPEPAVDVEVEAMAMIIPPEYFYVRLQGYDDLSWARRQIDQFGADLRDLSTARGFDYHLSDRIDNRLELRDTKLAQLLGPAVISDIAIIGSDTLLREGAGIGVVFHARVNELLEQNLNTQRQLRADSDPEVTLSDVTFEGDSGTYSLLSTPDNRVRSFYVRSGDFHLVTTSRTIARRFLEVSRDATTSLGATKEFRYGRTLMPLSRGDNAFLYMSDAFFRSFIRPEFRIEMTRRAQSESEMELVQLAALAASAEKRPADSLQDLILGGFMPPGFGNRPDGSELKWDGKSVTDSLRGARGAFLPVPDVTVENATSAEVKAYADFAKMYARLWRKMDPAVVAIRRVDEGTMQRVVLDLHVYPFPQTEFGVLNFLNPDKEQKQLAPIEGALVVAEGNAFNVTPIVAGLMDHEIKFACRNGIVETDPLDAQQHAFLGGRTIKAVEQYTARLFTSESKDGDIVALAMPIISQAGFALRTDEFAVLAETTETLEAIRGKLKRIDAARSATLRVHVSDLKIAKAASYGHAAAWNQANRISSGNAELLNRIVTQFRVSPENAVSIAETLFNAGLTHPLRGTFTVAEGQPISNQDNMTIEDYRHALLNKIRGAEFELTTKGRVLSTHFEILLDKDP